MENAGGSQVPYTVIDAMAAHLRDDYVQLGAGYPASDRASEKVAEAHAFALELVGGRGAGEVVLGPSTTALVHLLAQAYGEIWSPGDEVIVAVSNHEANIGPWVRLARFGVQIRFWSLDPESLQDDFEQLGSLLGPRTRMVAVPHVSNLIGSVLDVARVVQMAHAVGAKVCVDGVAFAPHRALQVREWEVDWYVYSHYKVYGPHLATLYGRHEAWAELTGPNHFFLPPTAVPYGWELGGVSHEACAGLVGLRPYLQFLSGNVAWEGEGSVRRAFAQMQAWEKEAAEVVESGLRGLPTLRWLAPVGGDRVGTYSFLHCSISSDAVARALQAKGIAMRHGHMYAYRLCESLGILPDPGVARASLVHTNTPAEASAVVDALASL